MPESEPAESEVSRRLVRSFSNDLARRMPNETLSRGLTFKEAVDKQQSRKEDVLRDQWNALLNEGRHLAISLVPDEEVFLLDQSRKLYEAWTLFCKQLPAEQQKGILTELPSIEHLYQSVSDASATWEENRSSGIGKIKKTFGRVCEVLNTHSNLVSIFPTDDKYVRLVTGSISAIARASINHTKLASGVADSLEELSQDMTYWNDLIVEYGSEPMMQRFIIELYVVVVEFLTEVFRQWSRSPWKRFIKSFDQDAFQNIFVEKRKRIKQIETRMQRTVDLAFKKRMNIQMLESRKFQEEMRQKEIEMTLKVDALFQTQIDDQGLFSDRVNSLLVKLGSDFNITLRDSLWRLDESTEASGRLPPVEGIQSLKVILPKSTTSLDPGMAISQPNLSASPVSSSIGHETGVGHYHYRLNDILNLLETIATDHEEQIQNLITVTSRARRLETYHQIRTRIMTWVANSTTDKLWIQGPHGVPTPSQNTLTAAFLVALANTSKIPCLYYFCSIKARARDGRSITSKTMLVQMLKSFIIQLLLIQKDDELDVNIPLGDLERLVDATAETNIDDVLVVFRSLEAVAPPHLHCVIEGFQELEDRGDPQHTRNLENVVREISSLSVSSGTDGETPQDVSGTLKLMYLSDGYVDVLAQATSDEQLERVAYAVEAERFEDGESTESSWLQEEDSGAW